MKNLSLLFCLLLCACVRTVYVPVNAPSITLPPEPAYPIYELTPADKAHYGKVSKAYVSSFAMCVADDKRVRTMCEVNK